MSAQSFPTTQVLLLAGGALLASCSIAIVPARPVGPKAPLTTVAAANGLSLAANAARWTGEKQVTRELTPIYVRVQNESELPVQLSLSDISLRSGSKRWSALTPSAIKLRIEPYGLGIDPLSHARANLYPAIMDVGPRRATRDEVIRVALSERKLLPGQVAQGFVYFEKLPAEVVSFMLHVGLTETKPSGALRSLAVQFMMP